MSFSSIEKNQILKIFTGFLKEAKGRGPKNIYIKYFDNEFHVVVQGVLSDFEKYLVKTFGQEAIEIFTSFYERDSHNIAKVIGLNLDWRNPIEFLKLESDFKNDLFIYKMSAINN